MYIRILCECNSFTCHKSIKMSIEESEAIRDNMDHIIIIEGCEIGPDPTDTFVEEKTGYSIYNTKA